MNRIYRIIMVLVLPFALFAQNAITGTVSDEAGNALPGANVVVAGTTMGAAADADGYFVIENVPNGTYTLSASVIGYERSTEIVTVPGAGNVAFALESTALKMSALEVFASRATRNTPVAYTNVEKEEIEFRLGSQDVPMVLNTTPSVYATMQGGGAGDARINVRGFSQRETAVMINGIPQNDMENGWVYWSNWDGISDATSSIQMQRGLSTVNLATPAIGGSMNIITDPASHGRIGKFKQEYGSGMFLKTTGTFHSGLINDKLALSGTVVRKTGDGLIDKVWTDAWAYYFGASYAMNNAHRFELYAMGAPQRHGQNRYRQNIGAYDHDFAKSLDTYDEEALKKFPQASADRYGDYDDAESGRFYNENWNVINSKYKTTEYYYMYGAKEKDRFAEDFLNERENFFHKPLVNLNHYWTLNNAMRLTTTAYFSGGSGGGTGTFGDLIWDYNGPSRIANWNATYETNQGTESRKGAVKPAGESVGFLRNSINRQWTIGAISKLKYDLSEDLKVQVGIDLRTAEIEHAREVRNLLGGNYAVNAIYNNRKEGDERYNDRDGNPTFQNEFATTIDAAKVGLGDIIDYHNTNTVDWGGAFAQAEYTGDLYSLYGTAGYSLVKYKHTNHFKKAENYSYGKNDKGELVIEADWLGSYQAKGGGLLKLMDGMDIYANVGYINKLPIFDEVIDDNEASLSTDPKNETFYSIELGSKYQAADGLLAATVNIYNTAWRDRIVTRNVQSGEGSSGDTDVIFLTGLDQDHRGLELELALRPVDMVRIDGVLSIGDWKHVDDAKGTYKNRLTGENTDYEYAVKDLKIGDQPQTQLALAGTLMPIDGLQVQGVLNWYDRHYSQFSPADRAIKDANDDGVISDSERAAADRTQSWEAPRYTKVDLHAYYNLPIQLGNTNLQVFAHIFNAFDEVFVQDAQDNSAYNGFDKDHDADDAEVYLGLPRSFNIGLLVSF